MSYIKQKPAHCSVLNSGKGFQAFDADGVVSGRESGAQSPPVASAEAGHFTGSVAGASNEPISGTFDLLDSLAGPSGGMELSDQVSVLYSQLHSSQDGLILDAASRNSQHRGVVNCAEVMNAGCTGAAFRKWAGHSHACERQHRPTWQP